MITLKKHNVSWIWDAASLQGWILLCRELEAAFDEERDACKAEKSKVARLEDSLGSEKKKLQEEIDEKLQIITDLSKQLEVHQKNFDALKMELSQVKR